MMRQHWLWLSLAASSLGHGVFGWQLQNAPLSRQAPPGRTTFDVRMVSLPPPVPPKPMPQPEPPAPKPKAPLPRPKPKPEPETHEPLHTTPAEPPPAEAPAPVEAVTAPPALLAESGASTGSIVQLAGATIGALAAAVPGVPVPGPTLADAPRAAPVARLSDLSRKPRAPSLDAALRDNYPAELRRRGTEGQAEVRVVIDALGRVGEIVTVSESARGFAEACRRTLLGSRWSEPLDREGRAVSTRLAYRCRFQIER